MTPFLAGADDGNAGQIQNEWGVKTTGPPSWRAGELSVFSFSAAQRLFATVLISLDTCPPNSVSAAIAISAMRAKIKAYSVRP